MTQAAAAVIAIAESTLSHRSGLLNHGLPVIGSLGPYPELTVSPTSRGSALHVHLHRARLRPEDVVVIDGLPTTSVPRTLIDVARHRSTATAVAAIDAALHGNLVTIDELQDVLEFCRSWPRIRRARRAVALADGLAESPLESVSRLVIAWVALPRPRLQAPICDMAGRFLGRADFYWDEPGVVGEADGRSKYDGRDVLIAEKERQEGLEDPGLVVTRWGWWHATQGRYALRQKLERAFARGIARENSGLPRLWSVSAA